MPESLNQEKYIIDKNGVKRRARRTHTDEFKQQIVDLYNTGNYSQKQLMYEYDLMETALVKWIRQANSSGSFKEKATEVLRGKLVQMQLEQHASSLAELRAREST